MSRDWRPWFLSWIVGRVLASHAAKSAGRPDDPDDRDPGETIALDDGEPETGEHDLGPEAQPDREGAELEEEPEDAELLDALHENPLPASFELALSPEGQTAERVNALTAAGYAMPTSTRRTRN